MWEYKCLGLYQVHIYILFLNSNVIIRFTPL